MTKAVQAVNTIYAGPSTGGSAAPTFRSLVAADVSGLVGVTTFSAGGTGLTPSTPTSGAIVLNGTLNPLSGGTGAALTLAIGDILYASSSTTMAKLAASATSGHVLTSNGSGVAPSYQAVAGGSVSVVAATGSTQYYPIMSTTTGSVPLAIESTEFGYNTGTRQLTLSAGYIAIGSTTAAAVATGTSVAIGQGANSGSGDGVAIGASSKAVGTSVAIGSNALAVSTGGDLVAVGNGALASNSTGAQNTAIGHQTLTSSTSSSFNTAVGYLALTNTNGFTANNNTAIGCQAMQSNVTGNNCVAIGFQTLSTQGSGQRNVAVGNSSQSTGTGGTFNTSIGHGSMLNSSANNAIAIGFESAGGGSVMGQYAIGIGYRALYNQTSGIGDIGIGNFTLQNSTSTGGNIAIGGSCLSNISTGGANIGIGEAAGLTLSTGSSNVIIGKSAGLTIAAAAAQNTIVGVSAYSNGGGTSNTVVGFNATNSCTGFFTASIGAGTFSQLSSGNFNTGLGANTGSDNSSTSLTTGSSNTLVGYGAGGVTTGSNNIVIGANNGLTSNGVGGNSNNILIGSGASTTVAGGIALGPGIAATVAGGFFVQHNTGGPGNNASFVAGELVETLSSRQFKDDIRPLEDVSDRIDSVHPVRYRYKEGHGDTSRENIGLIAEEIEEIFPEFVVYGEDGLPRGLVYDQMVALIFKALQEANEEIRKLKAEVAILKQ